MPSEQAPSLSLATLLRLFLPFGLGYFVSNVFRTVNAVIAPDLVAELGLSPADLGLLTSAYFLSFAAFQLPLGLLLDRLGLSPGRQRHKCGGQKSYHRQIGSLPHSSISKGKCGKPLRG